METVVFLIVNNGQFILTLANQVQWIQLVCSKQSSLHILSCVPNISILSTIITHQHRLSASFWFTSLLLTFSCKSTFIATASETERGNNYMKPVIPIVCMWYFQLFFLNHTSGEISTVAKRL